MSIAAAIVSQEPLAPALHLKGRDAGGLKRLCREQIHAPAVAALAALLAVQVAPSDAEAHLLHGLALARGKQFAGAAEALRCSLTIDDTSIPAWTSLGEVLLEALDYRAAKVAFEQVMRLDPHALDPYGRRARVVVAKTLQRLKKATPGSPS